MPDVQPNFREGDVWGARAANQAVKGAGEPITVRGSAGLIVRSSDKQIQIGLQQTTRASVAYTTSIITAANGFTSFGTGTAEMYRRSPTNVPIDTGQNVTVWSFSSTVGGIPIGTWIFIVMDMYGDWWVTTTNCS